MDRTKEREKLIDLIVNAKRADPETGSFTEFLADFLLGYGVIIPTDDSTDRFLDLVEADREGRCVVLPCKGGAILRKCGREYKADHWNVVLTAFADDETTPTGKLLELFSVKDARAALTGGE